MSYLTQILVSYDLAARQLKIRDSYDWHQRVWQAFKDRSGERRDFLTRIDEIESVYRLLIVSPTPPQQPEWCPPDCFQTKAIPEDYLTAPKYRFCLLANPTRKVRTYTDGVASKNGRRLPLTKREDLVTWIQRKASAGGFNIDDPNTMRIVQKPTSYFQKAGVRGVHHAVDFLGTLTVTDGELFRRTFTTGIGSAKAFGFGLLAITPIH